ncbi:Vesicle transport protein SEC20 [Dissostichus eleginoides]|uniref:Vesicle transport protein SEC20 n=1 Tax=Dissostichus eleginoides TaxID=100907 RepID=A0AAD9F227_DISEL|nr:Vesicle transport protein SEC20 [Dissostichus eleginoides]
MASSADVHVRICGQEIIKYDLEIKALVQVRWDCPGPQSTLMEFNSQVKEKFNKLRLRIQVRPHIGCQKKIIVHNQTAWRKANLACKLCIDHSEKDELLQGGDYQSTRQRKVTKECLVETSSNITESLMSISRMMSEQVKQSEDTIGTLATSSRTVLETNEEFKSMTGTIHFGRKLILKYNRRELTDKLLIFLALALFFATVLYILKKRLFPFI